MKSAFGLTSCADDGKEDIPVSGTGFCEFESRSAYFSCADDAKEDISVSGESHSAHHFIHR